MFSNSQLDGTNWGSASLSVCWCYDDFNFSDQPTEDELEVIDDYDTYFGSGDSGTGYMEFYRFDESCAYTVGTVPKIIYNLTGFGTGNGTKTVIYFIKRTDQSDQDDDIVFYGFLDVKDDYRRGILDINDIDYTFDEKGEYYIICQNTSDEGTVGQEFIHRSNNIYVCSGGTDAGDGGGGILPDLGETFGAIMGIIVLAFFILLPLALSTHFSGAGHTVHVPSIVYVLMGGIGVLINVTLGLFQMWVVYFIIAIGIISLGILYLMGQRGNGMEG